MTARGSRSIGRYMFDEMIEGFRPIATTPRWLWAMGGLGFAYATMFGIDGMFVVYAWFEVDEAGQQEYVSSWAGVIDEVILLVVIALPLTAGAVALSGGREAVHDWLRGPRHSPAGAALVTFGLPFNATVVGAFGWLGLALLFGVDDIGSESLPASATMGPDLAHSLIAGALAEELIVLAAPVVVVRYVRPRLLQTRRGVLIVIAVLVTARMFYHLYQGPSSTSHLLWAYISITVFVAIGKVWPLIVGHAYYNTVVTLWAYGYDDSGWLGAAFAVPIVALGAGLARMCRHTPMIHVLRSLVWPLDEKARSGS